LKTKEEDYGQLETENETLQQSYDNAHLSLLEYEKLKVQYNELEASKNSLQEQLEERKQLGTSNQVCAYKVMQSTNYF
jgi:Tfp pilus assembly protein PilO